MSIKVPDDAYCTLSEVGQLLPSRTYSSQSKPTLDQAEQHVKDVALEINAVLRGLGFSPPLTGADVPFLKSMNKLGSAAMIESSTMIGVQGKSEIATSYGGKYQQMLKDMAAGRYKFETAGSPPVDEADVNDDLDVGGERADPIFKISPDDMEKKF